MDIWHICNQDKYLKSINCIAHRVVEAQHIFSTRDLVDTAEEQQLLEKLLDETKPKLTEQEQQYHYLLATPFRYPPLKYGSRFGTIYQRGIWYGALDLETALTEKGYYQLKFLKDTTAELEPLTITLTAFSVGINTLLGIDLTTDPYNKYHHYISSPTSYTDSQKLGTAMRADNVNAFIYYSARSQRNGKNIGIYNPAAFASTTPHDTFQTWRCFVSNSSIEFTRFDMLNNNIALIIDPKNFEEL